MKLFLSLKNPGRKEVKKGGIFKMIRLTVSPERPEELFKTVTHAKFQLSRAEYWHVDDDGSVRAQSILWFACWAENGDGSRQVAMACENIFNQIFPFIYGEFEARVGSDFAHSYRYLKGDNRMLLEDIERMIRGEEPRYYRR
jgi:hypothetical protein